MSRLDISAVVLAGGRARRMGGVDKGLIGLNGKPLVKHVGDALAPQVDEVIINANRNRAQYRRFGFAVVDDARQGFEGPLAGMYAALIAAKHDWLLTAPCDGPLIAADYAIKMYDAAQATDAPLAIANDGERMQPVYSLIHRDLADDLANFLTGDDRKIDRWQNRHAFAAVDWRDAQSMFINVNTPEQLAECERLLMTRS